jgi:hypothetical protein
MSFAGAGQPGDVRAAEGSDQRIPCGRDDEAEPGGMRGGQSGTRSGNSARPGLDQFVELLGRGIVPASGEEQAQPAVGAGLDDVVADGRVGRSAPGASGSPQDERTGSPSAGRSARSRTRRRGTRRLLLVRPETVWVRAPVRTVVRASPKRRRLVRRLTSRVAFAACAGPIPGNPIRLPTSRCACSPRYSVGLYRTKSSKVS